MNEGMEKNQKERFGKWQEGWEKKKHIESTEGKAMER